MSGVLDDDSRLRLVVYRWLRPACRLFSPLRRSYVSGADIGLAMLRAHADGLPAQVVDNAGTRDPADRARAVGTIVPHRSPARP